MLRLLLPKSNEDVAAVRLMAKASALAVVAQQRRPKEIKEADRHCMNRTILIQKEAMHQQRRAVAAKAAPAVPSKERAMVSMVPQPRQKV